MEEFFYKNVGKKIKAVVLWTTIFLIIVVIGFGFTACGQSNDPTSVVLIPFIAILFAILILVSSYAMYALGQITEDADEMVKTQKEIVKLLEKMNENK